MRSLLTGPFVGVRSGSRGECGNSGQCRQDGGGAKDEVNVLEPNNQHVDVFTGWPSPMLAAGSQQVPGSQGLMEALAGGTQHRSAG